MNTETKETLKKVAEYTSAENQNLRNKMADMMAGSAVLLVFCLILFVTKAFGGAIAENGYRNIMIFTMGLTLTTLVCNILYLFGLFERVSTFFRKK